MIFQKFPQSYYWNIERLWEKYFQNKKPSTDFSELEKKYENQKVLVGNANLCSLPKFMLRKIPDFTPSENSVFRDDKGREISGLKNYSLCFQKISRSDIKKPVYFFDNHHQALFPFWEIFQEQKKQNPELSGVTIVHIDAHRDDAIFPHEVETLRATSLQEQHIQKLISRCKVSDYLDAGKKIGVISEIISVTQELEFQKFLETDLEKLISEKTPYILNLDIDIYGPEGTAVSTPLKTETIAKAWKNADAVCFATSPGFINAQLAEKLGEIMI